MAPLPPLPKIESEIAAAAPPACLAPPPRTWVEVDPSALRRNAERLARRLPPAGRLIFSAKKDGYGHGLLTTARVLGDLPSLAMFGVATPEEALALRADGREALCFAVLAGEALAQAVAAGVALTVTDADEATAAAAAARAVGRTAELHLKLDTGMGRMGRLPAEVLPMMARLHRLEGARLAAIYSHLADGWNHPASARRQLDVLLDFRRRAGLEATPIHLGGSDALALGSELPAGIWLRVGIALYGDHPAIADLEPAMNFKSRVIYRRAVPAGTAISYGMTFTTTRPSELALIGAGYGNGYPRSLSGRGRVLVGGRACPILGRVCMDQFVVDVTDAPGIVVGDEALLFGRQGEGLLPAGEIAALAGTISYELFCLAGQINPRVVL